MHLTVYEYVFCTKSLEFSGTRSYLMKHWLQKERYWALVLRNGWMGCDQIKDRLSFRQPQVCMCKQLNVVMIQILQ